MGIWHKYRTNENPKADGLATSFTAYGRHYRAKLYWAPADFSNPYEKAKQPYLVVWVSPDGEPENELRVARYVGQKRPRRSWKRLLEIGEHIDTARVIEEAAWRLKYHEAMLAEGCTHQNGAYYFPYGSNSDEIMARVREAMEV